LCPRPICNIVQNFTPIGVTVAEISITEHIAYNHRYKDREN